MSSMLCVCNPVMPVQALMGISDGVKDDTVQLYNPICKATASFQLWSVCGSPAGCVHTGIQNFLAKGATEIIANGKSQTGFYSSYFLVPKKSDLFKKFRWRHKVDVSQIVVLPVKTN